MHDTEHKPVLVAEIMRFFGESYAAARPKQLVLDCTLGGAGHAEALLNLAPGLCLVGFDRDERACRLAVERLRPFIGRVFIINKNFGAAMTELSRSASSIAGRFQSAGFEPAVPLRFDFALADLGLSSDQLNDPARGFAFAAEGPLDMRMTSDAVLSAGEVLNGYEHRALKQVFLRGGLSGRESTLLVSEIVKRRPLRTTTDFARACETVIPRYRRGEKLHHPATVPFQAVRIEVNAELESIESFLADAPQLLAPGGRLAVISFQSLEDQIVTRAMRAWSREPEAPRGLPVRERRPALGRLLTPHALRPTKQEEEENSRARSARLRVFERRGN